MPWSISCGMDTFPLSIRWPNIFVPEFVGILDVDYKQNLPECDMSFRTWDHWRGMPRGPSRVRGWETLWEGAPQAWQRPSASPGEHEAGDWIPAGQRERPRLPGRPTEDAGGCSVASSPRAVPGGSPGPGQHLGGEHLPSVISTRRQAPAPCRPSPALTLSRTI